MVDWSNIKPGDKVRVKRAPVTGWRFPIGAPVDLTQQELYVSLMRAGCRCGYLAKEREASS